MKTTFYTINFTNFAQAYGENAYGECTYNDTTSCTTTGGGSTGGSSSNGGSASGLENTGLLIAVIVTVACVIAMAAIIVRVMRRSNKKPALEAVPTDERKQQ